MRLITVIKKLSTHAFSSYTLSSEEAVISAHLWELNVGHDHLVLVIF